MKILLDESVPVQVARALANHHVETVASLNWKGRENGDLLAGAEAAGFDVMVIADKNLRYQQNLSGRRIALVELWTNHRPTLERYFAMIAAAVAGVSQGQYVIVNEPTNPARNH
jgi:predicted nuclease of predicted toxin-antitoxin system